MGVKSTRTLTRKEAEELYEYLQRQLYPRRLGFTDSFLEDELERMNDKLNNGEGFTNYNIERSNDD